MLTYFQTKILLRTLKDRCYLCKKIIVKRIKAFAEDIGIKTIFEGTNDLGKHRPGYRTVLEEENVYSPGWRLELIKKR